MHFFKKVILIVISLGVTVLCIVPDLGAISKSVMPFNKADSYDVYFYSGEKDKCVIKDVEIAGFQEIYGKTFLIVKPYGFKLKDVDGFILFDSVSAILPNQEFRVNSIQQIDIR